MLVAQILNWEEKKWLLLENLFSSKNWWWIWELLWTKILSEKWNIFAYSNAWNYFLSLGFKKIEWEKSQTWADLWIFENNL